jgi:hypothetical protein
MEKQTKQRNNEKQFVSMELSAVKIQQINKQPIVESFLSLSEDKKWLIHKTVITDIKPVSYFEKVMSS